MPRDSVQMWIISCGESSGSLRRNPRAVARLPTAWRRLDLCDTL